VCLLQIKQDALVLCRDDFIRQRRASKTGIPPKGVSASRRRDTRQLSSGLRSHL
jgi:hypothetical protein